jgi:hypothetical protein
MIGECLRITGANPRCVTIIGRNSCIPGGNSNISIGSDNCITGLGNYIIGCENCSTANTIHAFQDGLRSCAGRSVFIGHYNNWQPSGLFGGNNLALFGVYNLACCNASDVVQVGIENRNNAGLSVQVGNYNCSTCCAGLVFGSCSCTTAGCATVIGTCSCSSHSNATVIGTGLSSKVSDTVHMNNFFLAGPTGPYASDACFYAAGGTAGQAYLLCVGSDTYLTIGGYN